MKSISYKILENYLLFKYWWKVSSSIISKKIFRGDKPFTEAAWGGLHDTWWPINLGTPGFTPGVTPTMTPAAGACVWGHNTWWPVNLTPAAIDSTNHGWFPRKKIRNKWLVKFCFFKKELLFVIKYLAHVIEKPNLRIPNP